MAHSTASKEQNVSGQYAHYGELNYPTIFKPSPPRFIAPPVPPKPFNTNKTCIVAQQNRMSSFGGRPDGGHQRVQLAYQKPQQQQQPQNYLNYYRNSQGCSKHSVNCRSNENNGRNGNGHTGNQPSGTTSVEVPEVHKSMWSLNNVNGSHTGE